MNRVTDSPPAAAPTRLAALRDWLAYRGFGSFVLLALILLVVMPLMLDVFRLNLVGKYLTYAFVAIGLVMAWGYAGVLSLGQGVFFAIISQAIALILSVVIICQQGYTGGVNGITDLKTMLGWDIRPDSAKIILYFVNAVLLLIAILFCRLVQTSKLGTLLLAMRDKEDRVRFSGYDVAMFKVFAFCLAALLSAIGGAMFTLQVGFMSPSFVGIVPSVEMVIYAAVGGRMSLVGAVYGTLLVNFGRTYFSESFPNLWLLLMAALYIGVVMAFPDGLAGLYESHVKSRIASVLRRVNRNSRSRSTLGSP